VAEEANGRASKETKEPKIGAADKASGGGAEDVTEGVSSQRQGG